MKKLIFFIALLSFEIFAEQNANETNSYREGVDFSNNIKPNLNDIKNYDTSKFIEGGIDSNPEQAKYYGGVTGLNDGSLMSDGINEFNNSDLKDPIIKGAQNKPDLDLSKTIISDSLNLQNGIVTDKDGNFCYSQKITESAYKEKSCRKDNSELGHCTVSYHIEWVDEPQLEHRQKTELITPSSGNKTYAYFTLNPEMSGTLVSLNITYTGGYIGYHEWFTMNFLGKSVSDVFRAVYASKSISFNVPVPANFKVDKSGTQIGWFKIDRYQYLNKWTPDAFKEFISYRPEGYPKWPWRNLTVTYDVYGYVKYQKPVIKWTRNCDFPLEKESSQYKIIDNECSLGSSEKLVVDETGKIHTINLPCHEFKETYQKEAQESAECKILDEDPSCIQERKTCSMFDEKGKCVQVQYYYSCGIEKSSDGYQCGNLFYKNCDTDDCDLSEKNNDFGDVVSKLQTITEVAKDINDDPFNIKIFTGKGLECRKTAVGYNNCCSDSGWGQGVGLAGCDNEEKELGAAKEKGLVISVGEYCSNSVLGVCMQKKRSYCAFNSRLAKIVQQQGRNGQLNIGFGSAKSPDCRGMSLDEFEKINFDKIDFSEFYGDLNQQIDIPAEQTLKDRIKDK